VQCTDAQGVAPPFALGRRRIDGRSAARAERVGAPRAAVGGLYVDLGLAAENAERGRRRGHVRAERRASELLAVGAMADANGARIDLRRKRDLAAMTAAVDAHRPISLSALRVIQGLVCQRFSTKAASSANSMVGPTP